MLRQSILVSTMIFTGSLQAEDSKPVIPQWSGAAELGFINTAGNTDTSSINAKLNVQRKAAVWDYGLRLTALTSEEDDVTSKERYKGTLDLDRNFTPHQYLATTFSYESDRFSGYDYQVLLSVGYGYRLINEGYRYFDVEIGPGYRYDKLEDGNGVEEETVLRIMGKYFWKIRDGVGLHQRLSVNTDSHKTTWSSDTGLKSQINGSLAMKINYSWDYTNDVPVNTERTNTEFAITLVYGF